MRIEWARVSGYRAIPFCATAKVDREKLDVRWGENPFEVRFSTKGSSETPLVHAVIGANSAGKSSILLALKQALSGGKVDDADRNSLGNKEGKSSDEPIVIELRLVGHFADGVIPECLEPYCKGRGEGGYSLRVGAIWPKEGQQIRYLRRQDDECRKFAAQSKEIQEVNKLLPALQYVSAAGDLEEEANPKRGNLLGKLLGDIQSTATAAQQDGNRLAAISTKLEELRVLVGRDGEGWDFLKKFEHSLSHSLGATTTATMGVKLNFGSFVPDASKFLLSARIEIDDGEKLPLNAHGMGLQRSFALALLRAWADRPSSGGHEDYIFAVEEPEIYLHPHAARLMVRTLCKIAEHNQVLLTTHSSDLLNQIPLENIKMVRRSRNVSTIVQPDFSGRDHVEMYRYMRETSSDMLFARAVLLVEGQTEFYALPGFARTLGIDLDADDISLVYTAGMGNFGKYHTILDQFGIPHVLLGDADTKTVEERTKMYREKGFSEGLTFIHPGDFEWQVATALHGGTDEDRGLRERNVELVRMMFERCDKALSSGDTRNRGEGFLKAKAKELSQKWTIEAIEKALDKLGDGHKPLAGLIVGEVLRRDVVDRLTSMSEALRKVLALARGGNGASPVPAAELQATLTTAQGASPPSA